MLPAIKNRKQGPRLAFLAEVEPELLAEYLVAFANGDGGSIVLGLDESGQRAEDVWEEEAEGGLRAAARLCIPPVVTRLQSLEMPDGPLVVVHVDRSAHLHSLSDGRVLTRSGLENRVLGGAEISHLAASKA
ncbi:MAG: ATP-binding protein, partial [Chloroflexota bacterium]